MPPKRPNDDASASRPRKKAKLEADIRSDSESEESDRGYDFDEDSSEESSDSEPFQMPTNRKRGKMPAARRTIATKTKLKTKTAGQRNRVHVTFEVLFDQPLDIIVEIFSYLRPLDMLHLARAGRFVRSRLMSPMSIACWQSTWINAKGLPPCPDDMAVPAFISLMYEDLCFRCGVTRDAKLRMVSRARFCDKCFHDLSIYQKFTWDDIESGFRLDGFMLNTVIPMLHEKEYYSCEKYADVRYKSELQFCARFEDVAEFKHAWRKCPVAERERFLKDRQAKIKARQRHAKLCYQWEKRRFHDAEDQLAIAQARRYETIVLELKANGWGKVLEDMTADEMEDFKDLPDLQKAQKVTKATLKSMLPRLETFLNTCKRNHVKAAR